MTFSNPILPDTQSQDALYQKFLSLDELGYEGGGVLFCGHFDGHDVYRDVGADGFVLVYGNDVEAIFRSTWQKAKSWQEENPRMTQWCSMRAIIKGRFELVRQINVAIERLEYVKEKHSDDESFGVFVCDTCCDAAELLEAFKRGAGL